MALKSESSMMFQLFQLPLFSPAPVHIDNAGAGQGHEFLNPFAANIVFDRLSHSFGPADPWLQAHQFLHQRFIDRNCRTHNFIF